MMGVQMTKWAEERVERKRKKKGLGDLQSRQKRVSSQLFVHGGCMTAASFAIAPLERARLIHQTKHLNMARVEFPSTSVQLIPQII